MAGLAFRASAEVRQLRPHPREIVFKTHGSEVGGNPLQPSSRLFGALTKSRLISVWAFEKLPSTSWTCNCSRWIPCCAARGWQGGKGTVVHICASEPGVFPFDFAKIFTSRQESGDVGSVRASELFHHLAGDVGRYINLYVPQTSQATTGKKRC